MSRVISEDGQQPGSAGREAGTAGGDSSSGSAGPGLRLLLHSDELRFLNECYAYQAAAGQEPPAGGFAGRLKRAIRRRASSWLRSLLLEEYFESERRFNEQLVRLLNSICRHSDSTSWRMDDQTRAALHELRASLSDQLSASDAASGGRLSALAAAQEAMHSRLATLESVAAGLERIAAGGAPAAGGASDAGGGEFESRAPDYSYLLLENRFRGSEEAVAEHLAEYPELFAGVGKPVLEIGTGRGELQELFQAKGVSSYAVELDEAMVEVCRGKGLDVRKEDGIRHLEGLEDDALSGLAAVQVVEHLPVAALKQLLRLAASKVERGGLVVFETINTESIAALCQNYFRDPTHVQPLHPDTMRYLMEQAGLRVIGVEKRSPYPPEAVLQPLAADPAMPPRWHGVIEGLNDNLRRLNTLLFGHQDYRIAGRVE